MECKDCNKKKISEWSGKPYCTETKIRMFVPTTGHLTCCPLEENKKECKWEYSGVESFYNDWETACGEMWGFTNTDTPIKNGMKYCFNCGRKIYVKDRRKHAD